MNAEKPTYHDSNVANPIAAYFINSKAPQPTIREAQCLAFLLEGRTAKQIAYALHISHRTVETYLDNLKKKVGCRTRIELICKLSGW
jgi:DNA-binding NarL/FixJ family response regulator